MTTPSYTSGYTAVNPNYGSYVEFPTSSLSDPALEEIMSRLDNVSSGGGGDDGLSRDMIERLVRRSASSKTEGGILNLGDREGREGRGEREDRGGRVEFDGLDGFGELQESLDMKELMRNEREMDRKMSRGWGLRGEFPIEPWMVLREEKHSAENPGLGPRAFLRANDLVGAGIGSPIGDYSDSSFAPKAIIDAPEPVYAPWYGVTGKNPGKQWKNLFRDINAKRFAQAAQSASAPKWITQPMGPLTNENVEAYITAAAALVIVAALTLS